MNGITDYAFPVSAASAGALPATPTRRRLLALLGAGALTAGLAALPGAEPAEGKKKRHKGRGKGKDKGKGNGDGGRPNPPPPPPPPPSVEEQLLNLINTHRDDNGQAPLTWDDRLGVAAQNHSDDMTAHGSSSHTGSDGSNPHDRIVAAGYPGASSWGENIFESAPNDPSAQSAFTWWKNSPGHNANMLSPNYARIGLGQATNGAGVTRWTTVFASAPD